MPCHLGLCHIITHGKLFHHDKLVSMFLDEFHDQFIILFMNKKTLIKHYAELRFNVTWKSTYVTHLWHVVLHQDMCNTMFYFGSSNIFIACLHYYSLHFVDIMKWSIFPFLCSLIKKWVFQSHKSFVVAFVTYDCTWLCDFPIQKIMSFLPLVTNMTLIANAISDYNSHDYNHSICSHEGHIQWHTSINMDLGLIY